MLNDHDPIFGKNVLETLSEGNVQTIPCSYSGSMCRMLRMQLMPLKKMGF